MQERQPLYMGKISKETVDRPIDDIDTLIKQSALRMGAHVVETELTTYLGTNYPRQYAAEPFVMEGLSDPTEEHPELISV